MAKKIFLIIAGGVAALGILFSIIGYAMGGRLGTFYAQDGSLWYVTSQDRVRVSGAPGWMRGNWGGLPSDWFTGDWDHDYDYDYDYDWDGYEDYEDWYNSQDWNTSMPEAAKGEPQLAAPVENPTDIYIDAQAAHVHVVTGPKAGITIEGNEPFTSDMSGGTWSIRANQNRNNISSRLGDDGYTHYYHNGKDITMIITVVVPEKIDSLTLSIGLGMTRVSGLEATGTVSVLASLGNAEVSDVKAPGVSLRSELGNLHATGIEAQQLVLHSEMGNIYAEAAVDHNLVAESEFGNIEAVIDRPASYSYDISAEFGSITLDGDEYSGVQNRSGGDGDMDIELSSEFGNITVSFR